MIIQSVRPMSQFAWPHVPMIKHTMIYLFFTTDPAIELKYYAFDLHFFENTTSVAVVGHGGPYSTA